MNIFRLLFSFISPAYFLFAILLSQLVLPAPEVFAQGISINLGKTETGRYIKLVGNTAGMEGEIKTANVGSEYCAENIKTSMFFQLDKNYFYQLSAGKFFIINVEYYDEPGIEIKLVYDAIDEANKEFGTTIKTTGTNQWKSYGFYLDSCYFGHRQANQADFRLVAASGKMHINALSVVPVDYYFEWGTVNDSLGINQTERGGGDSRTIIVKADGEEAIQTIKEDNYLYLNVNDSLIYGGNHPNIFVSVQYFDNNAAQTMRLQYDSRSSIFKTTPFLAGKGSNCWRTVTFEINDAWFQDRQSGPTDMRLHMRLAGTPVNRIMVGILDKAPLPALPDAPSFSSYRTLDAPVIDGDLKDWAWQQSGSRLEYVTNPDGTRTDEYYRTWSLDPKNVPIVEAGEPNANDPGKEGLWDYNDLSGEVKVLWDEVNLYLSGAIKDNVVNVKGDSWEGKDGIGLYLDASHTILNGKPVAIKDDSAYQKGENFLFIPALDTDPGLWKHETSQAGEALPSAVRRVVKTAAGGYILEASIPLSLIKDGFTLKPGAAGDQDNFNPLFGYVINDNDGIGSFGGRLAFGAPNDDDESWGTLSLDPSPIAGTGIIIDLGPGNFQQFIRQVNNEGDGAVTPVEKDEKGCVTLSGGCAYFAVDDTLIRNGNHPHLFLSVEYFDEPSAGKFRIQYDGTASAYQDGEWVSLTGTGRWKTATFEIKDAKFNNSENGGADFRINSDNNNLILNQIKIGVADYWISRGDSAEYKIEAYYNNEIQTVTVGGKKCHRNRVFENGNYRYFYHALNDTAMYKGKANGLPADKMFLTVEYYDTTSSGGIGLNYDAKTNYLAAAAGDAMIQGTNQWKLHTFYLTDAYFGNRGSGMSDFRVIGKGSGNTFIKHVMIGIISNTPTGVMKEEKIPMTYALSQNYPNPFNPATTISYSIPEGQNVRLTVYDMLGEEISTLVHEYKQAGTYTINFNASSLPSGIYIYTLQTGQFRDSKKLVLLK
ncbi:MAG: T9SS type A sorting domain-containing protein [Syntrophomonadaceae bacterium]